MKRNVLVMLMGFVSLSSCISIKSIPRDPCATEEYIHALLQTHPSQINKLVHILKSHSYKNAKSEGCKEALLGHFYEKLDELSLASIHFKKAAASLPDLGFYFAYREAYAYFQQENYDQAFQRGQEILRSSKKIPTHFLMKIKKLLADSAVHRKNISDIIATHQALLKAGFSPTDSFLRNLGDAYKITGDKKNADDMYRRLLVSFPHSKRAQELEQQKSLNDYQLSLKEIEKRADKLIENLAFNQAVKDMDSFLLDKRFNADEQSKIHEIATKALSYNNQFAESIKRSSARIKTDSSLMDFATHAQALSKAGHVGEAAQYYQRMQKSDNPKVLAHSCFFRGFSLYEASSYTDALVAWQSCHHHMKSSDLYENYLWYQALALMIQGSFGHARTFLQDLEKDFLKSNEREKYMFFLGFLEKNLTHNDQELLRLARQSPTSYYAQQARQTLNLANKENQELANNPLAINATGINDSEYHDANFLYHLDFKDEARQMLTRSTMPRSKKLAALHHLGFYSDAYKLSNRAINFKEGVLQASTEARAAYPLPYATIINQTALRYELNPYFLYAIMQIESSFNENALSPRGAMGLMQMMPYVAQDLAPYVKHSKVSPHLLHEPTIAIELGALLIAILKRQFYQPHLVAAAYNAGAHNVHKWQNSFGHLPTELFIERIPFKQTRDYVKKVLFTESIYHALSGQKLRLLP